MCDRWDIGGLSTPWHWQTDTPSIFVYDGYPGGIGLSRRGYDAFESLAAAARMLVAECPCENGCPSCVQSPKCGNLNEPLSKAGAVALLSAVLLGLRRAPVAPPFRIRPLRCSPRRVVPILTLAGRSPRGRLGGPVPGESTEERGVHGRDTGALRWTTTIIAVAVVVLLAARRERAGGAARYREAAAPELRDRRRSTPRSSSGRPWATCEPVLDAASPHGLGQVPSPVIGYAGPAAPGPPGQSAPTRPRTTCARWAS